MISFAKQWLVLIAFLALQFAAGTAAEEASLSLPQKNGSLEIATQASPWIEGPRYVKVYIYYPNGKLAHVNAETGLMLSLHNWGGTHAIGTADPDTLANRYNVVAICVDYLQSGKNWGAGAIPYDFGYLQAIDALRALYFVFSGLQDAKVPFDSRRIYCTGGSGGGNVTLMVNKFAPRTFTCAIDKCGMAKLTEDIAFDLPGGSRLHAGYSAEVGKKTYLSKDAQAIRFPGNPEHLSVMKKLGNRCKLIVVHGVNDRACLVKDKREMVENMQAAGMDVEPHFITEDMLDGVVFKTADHALGDRTKIILKVADRYLLPDSPDRLFRRGKTDFELRDELVRYATGGGEFVISYQEGAPSVRFQTK